LSIRQCMVGDCRGNPTGIATRLVHILFEISNSFINQKKKLNMVFRAVRCVFGSDNESRCTVTNSATS